MTRVATVGSIALFRDDQTQVGLHPCEELVVAAAVLFVRSGGYAPTSRKSFYTQLSEWKVVKRTPDSEDSLLTNDYIRKYSAGLLAKLHGAPSAGKGSHQLLELAMSADIMKPDFVPEALILWNFPVPSSRTKLLQQRLKGVRDALNSEYLPLEGEIQERLRDIGDQLSRNEYKSDQLGSRELSAVRYALQELSSDYPGVEERADYHLVVGRMLQHTLWFNMVVKKSTRLTKMAKIYERAKHVLQTARTAGNLDAIAASAANVELITEYTFAVYRRQNKIAIGRHEISRFHATAKQTRNVALIMDWENEIGHQQLAVNDSLGALGTFADLVQKRPLVKEQAVAMFNVALALARLGNWELSAQVGGAADRAQKRLRVGRTQTDLKEHADWEEAGRSQLNDHWEAHYRSASWEMALGLCTEFNVGPAPNQLGDPMA